MADVATMGNPPILAPWAKSVGLPLVNYLDVVGGRVGDESETSPYRGRVRKDESEIWTRPWRVPMAGGPVCCCHRPGRAGDVLSLAEHRGVPRVGTRGTGYPVHVLASGSD